MSMMQQKYDRVRIEKLKTFLEDMAAKEQPRPYEIYVDHLKVVPKTDNPDEFEGYEQYMDNNTEQIMIVIFGSGASPRNEKYCFTIEKEKDKPLNGLGEIETIVQEKLDARDREHEMADLKKELAATKQQLEEAEEYAEDLEQQLEAHREGKIKKTIQFTELAGGVLNNILQRNAHLLNRIPGAEALTGMFGADQVSKNIDGAVSPETGASFQKKKDTDTIGQLTDQQLQYLAFVQEMEAKFTEEQMPVLMQIIGRFMQEPAQLQTVAELLNVQTTSP